MILLENILQIWPYFTCRQSLENGKKKNFKENFLFQNKWSKWVQTNW